MKAPKRVRLLHIATVPESLSFLKGQAGYMRAHGFDVSAVSAPGDYRERFQQDEEVEVHAVAMVRRITPLRDLISLFQIIRRIREQQPAIVHGHTPKGGLLSMLGAMIARVPVRVYHMRGLPMVTAAGYRRLLLRWTERVACLCAHQVISVSHSVREAAVQERLCPSWKIKVLVGGSGNGVDQVRFDPARVGADARRITRTNYGIPGNAVVIGFLGRLTREKGLVELIDAWDRLSREFPSVHLLIAGALDERHGLPPETLSRIRSDPRIHWKGVEWDTPPLYAAMDVVALPTYREGFPNVALETAAMALPLVATNVPGCTDAVENNVTGVLVPPRDIAALAAALRRYVTDSELRQSHGQAARRRVERMFRQDVIWAALYAEYRSLLESHGPEFMDHLRAMPEA